MTLSISIAFPQSLDIRTTKRWEQLSPSDGFSAAERGDVGQFGFYTPYILNAAGQWVGSWSSNINYSVLPLADMRKVEGWQIPDEETVAVKMRWLTAGWNEKPHSPMWKTLEGDNWYDPGTTIRAAGLVYAGQKVRVIDHRTFTVDFNGARETVPMSRIQVFSKADLDKTHASHPWLIQKVTVVDRANRYGERPKGIVYAPLALGAEFDFAGAFVPDSWWLLDRWLV